MGNLADYFQKQAYKPTYEIGDRVFGKFNGIPFVGSVGNDRVISLEAGPEVTIHLDLPIKVDSQIKTVIIVKHKHLKRLKSMDDKELLTLSVAGSIPVKRTKTKGK